MSFTRSYLSSFLVISIFQSLLACGGDDDSDSTDGGDDDPAFPSGSLEGLTYHKDIAPVLAKHCLSCHGGGGLAPFALTSYEEVLPHASTIKNVTTERIMPPWLADNSGLCNTYRDARWLTDLEIAQIGAWVDDGSVEGDPFVDPIVPDLGPGLTTANARLDPGVEYTPNAALADDYRCFVVNPLLDVNDVYLTAFEVLPANPQLVHHILLYSLDTVEVEAEADALDAGEEGPGYTCFGGTGLTRTDESRLLGGWAPGVRVTRYPTGTGVLLNKDRKVVMQIHYHLHAGTAPDRTRLDLEVADTVAEPAQVLPLADLDMVLPAGQAEAQTSISVDIPALPITGKLWGVMPHMHMLGTTLRVDAVSATENRCIVDVPRWDFNWQQPYFYTDPLVLTGGTTVTLTCTYDTTARTEQVIWGEGSDDEMCLNYFYISGIPDVF